MADNNTDAAEATEAGGAESGHNKDSNLGGYAESMAEIESILASLEGDVDIDTLASRVERASVLIAHCERKLRDTELSLQTILASQGGESAAEGS